jgi:hypothetical protein
VGSGDLFYGLFFFSSALLAIFWRRPANVIRGVPGDDGYSFFPLDQLARW